MKYTTVIIKSSMDNNEKFKLFTQRKIKPKEMIYYTHLSLNFQYSFLKSLE